MYNTMNETINMGGGKFNMNCEAFMDYSYGENDIAIEGLATKIKDRY